eukprot:8888903-Ditylum_brightwellii.AAC.1
MDNDPKEDNNKLYDTTLLTYHKFKQLPLSDQPEIKKLRWNADSKQKTACGNKEVGKIAGGLNITTIQDLNTLYYDVAIMVSPPKPETVKCVLKDPMLLCQEKLEKGVEYARKL